MVRLLIIVSVASFVLCLACFAVVSALGGADLARNGWNWNWDQDGHWNRDSDHRDGRRARIDWTGPVTTRDIAFTGAPELEIDVPADITYTQGPQARLSITGPKDAVDRIEVEGGEIRLRGRSSWRHHGGDRRLTITVVGPDTKSFVLHGSQTLVVDGYQQDSLNIELSGAGEVKVSGTADRADIDIAGAGEVDLRNLALNHAKLDLAGAGDVTMGPKLSADIDIAGVGDVTLLTRPPELQTDIAGAGDINILDAAPPAAPATPAAPAPKATSPAPA